MKILVSACLLGVPCRYDGGDNLVAELLALPAELVPFCPEVYGGLPTPRPASERLGNAVVTRDGTDVTAQFQRGAEEALRLAKRLGCSCAIFKERSPSCGCGQIYDGSFQHRLIGGNGVAAQLLLENCIPVVGESQLPALLGELD